MTTRYDNFNEILAHTLNIEGGYVNHKNDLGGATAFGITEEVARQYGYRGSMHLLPLSTAAEIYRKLFWVAPGFDKIGEISMPIAAELFDTYVNMGRGNTKSLEGPEFWLQRWLNAFNQQGSHYPDIVVDGQLGAGTRAALTAFLKRRGKSAESVMVKALNGMQSARYLDLTEAREKNEDFTFGWIANRV